jgi:hypothetical protein
VVWVGDEARGSLGGRGDASAGGVGGGGVKGREQVGCSVGCGEENRSNVADGKLQ